MALAENRVLILRDADLKVLVLAEDGGELWDYTFNEFILLLAEAHLNAYTIMEISDSVINDDDPMVSPFGCEEEANDYRESWRRLSHYDEYLTPMGPGSKKTFLTDFDKIYSLAEREGLKLEG